MPASTVNVATSSSHGKMDKSYALEECPSYLVEHLATFGVGPQFGLQWPSDGIRKLKQMERSSAIWAQRMILRLLPTALVVEDENGEAVENFPLDLVSDPTAHLSTDPRDLYNNLLVFVVNEGKNKRSSAPTEMHIFQCVQVSASQLADDIKQYLRGRFKAVPPGRRSGGIAAGGMTTSQVVDGYGHGYSRSYQPRVTAENGRMNSSAYRDIDQKSTFSDSSVEFFERDVNTLNRCFDDIERFVARIQSAAIAQRELEALQQQRRAMSKSSKGRQQMQRHPGDGILMLRAQLPTELEFFDILQKFKLCFNLLAKLKNHIHEPNAPELLHFLFTPLAIIVDACQWAFGRSIAPQVVSPLITRAAKALLLNCLTSKESEIWASLGESWRMTTDEWRGPPPGSYTPTFADGYVPYYDGGASTLRRGQNLVDMQLSGELNRVSLERERLDLAKERLQEEERRIMHEKRALEQERRRLLEEKRQFYEEQEQRSVISERIARPPPPPNGVYSSATLSRSRPELYKDMPRDADLRRGGVVPDENAQQMSFLEELRFKGAKAAQVTYERPGQNAKELSVRKGEFLEVLNDRKNWWQCRDAFGNEGFVPHTILTVVDGTLQQQQQQQRSRSVDEPLFVRAPTSTSTFGPSAGSYPSHAGSAELDATRKANSSPRPPFPSGIAASTNGDTPDAVRQRRGKLESSSSSTDPYASTCSTIRRRLVGLSAPVACDPPVPPPAPPLPPKLNGQREVRKKLSNGSTIEPSIARDQSISSTDESSTNMGDTDSRRMLNEELHQTLKQSQIGSILKQKPSSRCPMVKICELSRISTKQDVADWLQAKGFSGRTVNVLRDYDGEKVLTMTKSQLEEACGRAEGGRLYSQLLLQKSVTNFVPKSDDELNSILAARKSATDEACSRPVPEVTSFSSDQISPLSDDTGSMVPSDDDESFTIAL